MKYVGSPIEKDLSNAVPQSCPSSPLVDRQVASLTALLPDRTDFVISKVHNFRFDKSNGMGLKHQNVAIISILTKNV